MHRAAAPSNVQLPPKLASTRIVNEHPETSIYRPSAARTRSSSSITSVASIQSASTPVHVHGVSSQAGGARYATPSAYAAYPARDSPGASSNRSSNTTHEEIESSLRQWREHVFPSLKAGNYISPAGDTPDRERGQSFIEPILPDIFNTTNAEAYITTYSTGQEFLDDCSQFAKHEGAANEHEDEDSQRCADNWRLEMVLGQTSDAVSWDERTQAIWMNVWSGREEDGTRLLECCLCKFPGRPVVLASPIPIDLLPTALLQYRMRQLLEAFLSHPSVSHDHPFSVVMGPTRLVDAFLLHYEADNYTTSSSNIPAGPSHASGLLGPQRQQTILASSSSSPTPTQAAQLASTSAAPCSVVKSIKPLIHTVCNTLPPAVSLSEGFAVRLAQPTDDLTTLGTLFQNYSATLDVHIDEQQARQALYRAMHSKSVWIYHVYSQSLPGLHLIAGFLTTERLRRTSSENKMGTRRGGSIAITAVYTEENYRKRGVAESLVRAATRFYMSGKEGTCNTPAALPAKKDTSAAKDPSPKEDEESTDKGNIDYISVFVDARAESAISLFSRVGYGIGEREVVQDIPVACIRKCLSRQVAELDRAQEQEIIHHISSSASIEELAGAGSGSESQDVETDDGVHTPLAERAAVVPVEGQGSRSAQRQDSSSTDQYLSIPPSEDDGNEEGMPDARLTCRSREAWQIVTIVRKVHGAAEDMNSTSPNPNYSPNSAMAMKRFAGRRDQKRLSMDRPWL